jgi:predicted PurR-regulated permease PerM
MDEDDSRTKRSKRKGRSLTPAILLAAGLFVLIRSFPLIAPILLSFLLIVVLSLALNPCIVALRRWIGGRTTATLMVAASFVGIVALTALAFFKPVERSAAKFFDRMPHYWERVQRPLVRMEQRAVLSEERLKREIRNETNPESTNAPSVIIIPINEEAGAKSPTPLRTGLAHLFNEISGSFRVVAMTAASALFVGLTVFVGVIYTLVNPRALFRTLYGCVPERHHTTLARIMRRIVLFIPRWALATFLGMCVIGVMVFFSMWPIFGFQDALVLGLLGLILEAVPYVGPILAGLPALLLAIGEGGYTPLWVVIAYTGIQLLEHNLISPLIVGAKLNLHPVAVIFSALFCVTLFGILGVLLAVPIVATVGILHEELYRPRFLPATSDADLDILARWTLSGEVTPPTTEASPPEESPSIEPGTDATPQSSM